MVPRMSALVEIRDALCGFRPALTPAGTGRAAAVALVLREQSGDPEVLLIHRAEQRGDPWSGHMALPGGRVDGADASAESAARRETLEEVGLDLRGAAPLCRLDDLQGRQAGRPNGMVISAFVYHCEAPGALTPDAREVQDAFFFPLRELANPARHIRRRFRDSGGVELPGIVVGDPARHIVWGLTYRFIEDFHRALKRPFPAQSGE